MSLEDEPLPPELDELVRGMRDDALSPDEVADVARRLGPALGPTGGSGGAAGAGAGAWVAGGLAAIAIAIGIGWAAWPRGEHRAAAPAPSAPAPVRSVPPQPPAPVAPELEPARASAPAPAEPGAPAPRPERVQRERRPDRGAPPGAAEEEHTLLADARRALPSDPARALALADSHRARFAEGILAPEREMIAIDALEALGRRAEGEARARALVARWPSSAYARRVRARGLAP